MSQDSYYEPSRRRDDRRSPYESRERGGAPRSSGDYGGGRSGDREPPRRPKKKKRRSAGRTAALVLLYVTAVIGLSILLACAGWVAAGDVLALDKPEKGLLNISCCSTSLPPLLIRRTPCLWALTP